MALHNVLLSYKSSVDMSELKENINILLECSTNEIENNKVYKFNHYNAILRNIFVN